MEVYIYNKGTCEKEIKLRGLITRATAQSWLSTWISHCGNHSNFSSMTAYHWIRRARLSLHDRPASLIIIDNLAVSVPVKGLVNVSSSASFAGVKGHRSSTILHFLLCFLFSVSSTSQCDSLLRSSFCLWPGAFLLPCVASNFFRVSMILCYFLSHQIPIRVKHLEVSPVFLFYAYLTFCIALDPAVIADGFASDGQNVTTDPGSSQFWAVAFDVKRFV